MHSSPSTDNLFKLEEKLSHVQGWQILFFLILRPPVQCGLISDLSYLYRQMISMLAPFKELKFSEGDHIQFKYFMNKNIIHIIKNSHTRAIHLYIYIYICLCKRIYFGLLYRNNGKSSEAHCDQ